MRKGEIKNLKWSNIDFENRYIELLKTKSGKARKIPISDKLMAELIKLKANKISEYIFTNPITRTKYTHLQKGFTSALKKANIENFRFHDLRHTACKITVVLRKSNSKFENFYKKTKQNII